MTSPPKDDIPSQAEWEDILRRSSIAYWIESAPCGDHLIIDSGPNVDSETFFPMNNGDEGVYVVLGFSPDKSQIVDCIIRKGL